MDQNKKTIMLQIIDWSTPYSQFALDYFISLDPVLFLLGSQSYLDSCYLKAELAITIFICMTQFCFSWVVSPTWDVVI